MAEQKRGSVTVRQVCLALAVLCFVLAAFGVKAAEINLLYLGLAFWAGSGLL